MRTWWPRATSASTVCEPMKPAPPVTRIRMPLQDSRAGTRGARGYTSRRELVQQPARRLPHLGRGESEGGAIQQIVDEAAREAQGQQRRHEGRGAQPPGCVAEDAVGVDELVAHGLYFQHR